MIQNSTEEDQWVMKKVEFFLWFSGTQRLAFRATSTSAELSVVTIDFHCRHVDRVQAFGIRERICRSYFSHSRWLRMSVMERSIPASARLPGTYDQLDNAVIPLIHD